jgi:carbamoyltransferase
MISLGINNMHDASASLVVDGRVVAAAEEERFVRIKHINRFPKNAIQFCINKASIKISDIDIICASWKPWTLRVRATQALKSLLKSPYMFKAKATRGVGQMHNEWSELFRLRKLVESHFGKGKYKIEYLDHHLSHAASAFLCSPFEKAAILTVDGAGEADTTVSWAGESNQIKKIRSIRLPDSLGQFYSAVTSFLGFKVQHDEYKVMGLASYGEPVYKDYLEKNVVKIKSGGLFEVDPFFIDYHLARNGKFRRITTDVFGKPREKGEEINKRHADIAASAQFIIEEAIFNIANHLHETIKSENLCLSGGVAFNCVANGKLINRTPFRNIFIQPAAGDAGSALGAALYLENKYTGRGREYILNDAYLGPSFNSAQCKKALEERNLSFVEIPQEMLIKQIARALADGKLVCWFQGRMEWGPRALGNRSFLADPRRKEMKDIINLKIKKREPFRPFAPSILEEKHSEYFVNSVSSPFMLFAFDVKSNKKNIIPAVTHVDGTARPQTVDKDSNPLYWKLIKEFEKKTGVPVILNTSLNVQEPIVCTPEQAIDCYMRTETDFLVLNNFLVERMKS